VGAIGGNCHESSESEESWYVSAVHLWPFLVSCSFQRDSCFSFHWRNGGGGVGGQRSRIPDRIKTVSGLQYEAMLLGLFVFLPFGLLDESINE
jgi:hypothetical protein